MRRLAVVLASLFFVALVASVEGAPKPFSLGREAETPFWSSDGRLVGVPRFELAGASVSVFDNASGFERSFALPFPYSSIIPLAGNRVAFVTPQYVLDIVSFDGQPIAHYDLPYWMRDWSWSPDGDAFSYTSYRTPSAAAIEIFPIRTGAARSIGSGYASAWSPDGLEIAVARRGSSGTDIYAVRADGSGERLLGDVAHLTSSSIHGLTWSPDRRSIAVGLGLSTYVLTDRTVTRLEPARYASAVVWSPRSDRLALLGFESTLVVDRDGGRPTEFEATRTLAWSPDGAEVLYAANGELRTRPGLGGEAKTVTTALTFGLSPDARKLALLRAANPADKSDCLEDRVVLLDRASRSERVVGRCWIPGAAASDDLRGSEFQDELDGFDGADRLRGLGGADLIRGWQGRDTLYGGRGVDSLLGGTGRDRLFAGDGEADTVDCGPGVDRAFVDAADVVARNCERVARR